MAGMAQDLDLGGLRYNIAAALSFVRGRCRCSAKALTLSTDTLRARGGPLVRPDTFLPGKRAF